MLSVNAHLIEAFANARQILGEKFCILQRELGCDHYVLATNQHAYLVDFTAIDKHLK